MIDETAPHIPCWLVWSTTTAGLVTLEAISLTPRHAKYARKLLLERRDRQFINVKIEESQCNHMFACDLDAVFWTEYWEQASQRIENSRLDMVREQLRTAQNLGDALFQALGTKDNECIRKAAMHWRLWYNASYIDEKETTLH